METLKSMFSFKQKNILFLFLLFLFINIQYVYGLCQFNGVEYKEYSNWVHYCNNCTCIESVPFCEKIQCKYEACEPGKLLILNDDQCCPTCQEPRRPCHYDNHLINHNTEFSPKICTTCKCKNGELECYENCSNDNEPSKHLTNQNNRNLKPRNKPSSFEIKPNDLTTNICYYDNKIYQFNSTWSPLKCVQCKCGYNSNVDCFVHDCPSLNCPNGLESEPDSCCPKCKPDLTCSQNGYNYKHGDYWTSKIDPCLHCSCLNGQINCFKQNCSTIECAKNDLLVTKSNRCCPQCESQMSENCDYYGKLHYNGEMWYTNGCQQCACISGRVVCTNVQCESTFCLKDEIMVKKKDTCCISCRKPKHCSINDNLLIKEKEFYESNSIDLRQKKSSNPCKLCQCIEGEIICFSKSCQNFKYPTFAHLSIYSNEKKFINAHTIPFLTDFIKSMNKEAVVFVSSGPKFSNLFIEERTVKQFKINDISSSKIYYKMNDNIDAEEANDYVVLSFLSHDNRTVYNVLLEFELLKQEENIGKIRKDDLLPRSLKHLADLESQKPKQSVRKTIFVQPGEAIKLTSNELKPKNLPSGLTADRLVYSLASARPKYGELKLKKVFAADENVPNGWNKVNDLYLEKPVKDFTQSDLDNGNVWYEPYNDAPIVRCNNEKKVKKKICLFESCEEEDTEGCGEGQAKYDHCMFEVFDQTKPGEIISKEIVHFSIQNEIINETMLGLEVIENQITPLTFSNFDIAGIDSARDYLVYRIIKGLEKDQGQLEHAAAPGLPVETFTQLDLNKGLILYHSPKEIGVNTREFFFTFVVTNDNRSDTFPETPFHVKVLPANDQAPIFKEPITTINILQSGSVILPREVFDVEDPDTSLDSLLFTIESSPENTVIELRSKGQRYVLSKDDGFTIEEIRDATFRLIHNGATIPKDTLKISVSDNKHISIKIFDINIKLLDKMAPRASERSTMMLNVKEGQVKTIRRENLAFSDDHSSPEEIYFKVTKSKISGRLFNRDKHVLANSVFTQADVDLQNVRYESPIEIGQNILTESIVFDVMDKEGNVLKDQTFVIKVEPVNNQAPVVDVLQAINVQEGGYLMLNESFIYVRDVDSAKEQLNVIIDSQPSFGFLENIHKGTKLSSFPFVDLIDGLSIRYVQSDHQNKEPTLDSFIFHVSDGLNESPNHKLAINIQTVNDEKPVAVFEPLFVELNKQIVITNSSLYIVDFDSKPEDISISVEKFPKHGKIWNVNNQLNEKNRAFTFLDVLNKKITYRLDDKMAIKDEIMFKISDGIFNTTAKYIIKKSQNEKSSPIVEKNEGLQAIQGHIFSITTDMLYTVSRPKFTELNDNSDYNKKIEDYILTDLILYHVLIPPEFGKLQLRFDNFYQEIQGPYSFMNTFTQNDINQGRVYYNHGAKESTGVTSFKFNVSDSSGNVLPDQRFIITVRGDKLPPVIAVNKGLKVNQGQSTLLTRYELDIKDDDTPLDYIKFYIVTQPKLGRLEHQKEPGRRIESFVFDDLVYKNIRYIHEDINNNLKNDLIDFKVSDGKNDVSASVYITITRSDNQMPLLKSKFLLKCKELERKQITTNEIQVFDRDTPNDDIKIIITHPPQYGLIEKLDEKKIDDQIISLNTNTNQKLNFILKFNNNQTDKQFISVNEFTMSDVEKGLIYYNHRSPGIRQDRFGFIVYDGFNNMFLIDGGIQVSTYQIFNINVDLDTNQAPFIDKNIGLNYLTHLDGFIGRAILKSELSVIDKDDADSDIFIEITRKPLHGFLSHKDRPSIPIHRFTQHDINQNKIFYILKKVDEHVTDDFFEFDAYDLAKNYLKQNRFEIHWSVLGFKEEELSVMETEGKARVHVRKSGNSKQYSMVTCKTVSDTAKSNRDSKQYDFVHTNVRVEFSEDESYRACDVIINKDALTEPIESFYIVLEEPKYAIIGSRAKIKINILDKKKESILEFEKIRYEVQESDKFISLGIVRSGDLNSEVQVECLTGDDTALSGADYVPRVNPSRVRIAPGEVFGFCDIEVIDDEIKEIHTEYFKVYLNNPSEGARLGPRSDSVVAILGPNDDTCRAAYQTLTENDGQVFIEISRQNFNSTDSFEVMAQSISTNDIYLIKNLSVAEPGIDYEPVNEKIKFLPDDKMKKIKVNLFKNRDNRLKIFTVQINPIGVRNLSACDLITPELVNVIIGERDPTGVIVGFNQTTLSVNETSKIVSVPIIRSGDLSKAFSLICHTKQQTAIEGKDYVGREGFEHSRVYFAPGDRVKTCQIEIINDQIFEADETFQIKLSDLRASVDVRLGPYSLLTVTILNNEDSCVISLSDEIYYTEEPSSSDSTVIKTITVLRNGDLSRISLVRISTSDDTARAGLDYKPKTEILKFNPGVSALDFEVEILYDFEREGSENFRVILGPQEPVSAVFGKIKAANVIIKDIGANLTNDKFENSPIYLNSLVYHALDQTSEMSTAPIGQPLICFEPCDLRNPKYYSNRKLCELIDKKRFKTSYSWEISAPNEFGEYSQFIKLGQNSIFSFVNESILESVYFQSKFRIRCVIDYNSRTLKSNPVQIVEKNQLLFSLKNDQKCEQNWSNLSKKFQNLNNTFDLQTSLYSKSDPSLPLVNFKPFIAKADYVSAEFIKNNPSLVDSDHLNFVRLSVEIPYSDGVVPLVSTMPLYNHRHLLNNDFEFYPNHICSNFIDLNERDLSVKFGFVKYMDEDLDFELKEWTELNEKINSFRNEKTLDFYSSLDNAKCVWKFVAFYDLTELTSYCQAQIISSDMSDTEEQNFLSIKIPLYVSYLYANQQATWSSVDYKTSVEAPIIYKTKESYDREFFVVNKVDEGAEKSSVSVSKISMTENGKLIIEFSTVPSFHGQFINSNPQGPQSAILPPEGLDTTFSLELVWSQYTYDFPEQTWKATSTSVLNNYSGNYTIRLVPCYAKPDQAFKYPFECEPREPINYTIPITVEQSSMPVPVKYSLGTRFTLSNNLINSINPSTNLNNFDGNFRRGDTIYGTVIWDGDHDQKSVYILEIDKVFLCSSFSDFVPVYDPEGNIYNKGPQFGCSHPHKSLKHRILLLDKYSKGFENSKFEAKFLNEFLNTSNSTKYLNSERLRRNLVIDGFKFNLNVLFEIENLTKSYQDKDTLWYVQVVFYIRAGHSKQTRHLLQNIFNNGTNMNIIRLTGDKKTSYLTSRVKASKNKDTKNIKLNSKSQNTLLKVIIPLVVLLVLALSVIATLIYYKKEELIVLFNKNRESSGSRSENLIAMAKKKFGKSMNKKELIENYNGSNSTNETIVVVSPLLEANKAKTEDGNLTFQTSVSKCSNNRSPSQIDEEEEDGDHYIYKNTTRDDQLIESKNIFFNFFKNIFKSKEKKCILKSLNASSNGDYEDLNRNFIGDRYQDSLVQQYPKYPTLKRNNYLYFNYNNNKMNYFSSDGGELDGDSGETKYAQHAETIVAIASMSASTPAQTTPVNSTTICSLINTKRLSGTEV